MKRLVPLIILLVAIILFLAFRTEQGSPTPTSSGSPSAAATQIPLPSRFDFSQINATYRFSAELPEGWTAVYVPTTQAINIYDPRITDTVRLEQSQIFIRNFKAADFLTLDTVDILKRNPATLHGHAAVEYEIVKKPEVPDFAGQPSWRSRRHKLIDVRYEPSGTSTFYVIAYNPALDPKVFESFLGSILFK